MKSGIKDSESNWSYIAVQPVGLKAICDNVYIRLEASILFAAEVGRDL